MPNTMPIPSSEVERCRQHWEVIARKYGWAVQYPLPVHVWVHEGAVVDSVAYLSLTHDIIADYKTNTILYEARN